MRGSRARRLVSVAAATLVLGGVLVLGTEPAAAATPRRTFTATTPCRVVDTRTATPGRFLVPSTRAFQVTGDTGFAGQGGTVDGCDIPVGATAVEASVTAVQPGGTGFTRVWPDGTAAPGATFLNFTGVGAITNTGTVAIGANGRLRLGHAGAASHYTIDVQGYFSSEPTGAGFDDVTPCRLADTRHDPRGSLPADATRTIQVTGDDGPFAEQGGTIGGCGIGGGTTAVEVSVTAVGPRGSGFTRVWPADVAPPRATFLNFTPARSITNTGTVALGADGQLTLGGFGTASHYVIDVQGAYRSAAPSNHVSVAPCRLADTRRSEAISAGQERGFWIAGYAPDYAFETQGGTADGCRIPSTAVAVEVSITAITPTRIGYARVRAEGARPPTTTFLNLTPGTSLTNTGTLPLGTDGRLRIGSYGTPAHYVIDVQGYYRRPGAASHVGRGVRVTSGGSLSADGRYVAYVVGDVTADVYLTDRTTGVQIRVTRGDDASDQPIISDDGRYVAFTSSATNLLAGPPPPRGTHLYLWDRLAPLAPLTRIGATHSFHPPVLSGDGRYVAHRVGDDLVVWDRSAASSVVLVAEQFGYASTPDDFTPDGRFLAFSAETSGDGSTGEVRVWDRQDGSFDLVAAGNGRSRSASISGDGRHVAFDSESTNLVTDPPASDPNGQGRDVFVADRSSDTIVRLTQGDQDSYHPSISGDGGHVAFVSRATDLVSEGIWASGGYGYGELYRWERANEVTTLLVDPHGGEVRTPEITPDGRHIGFFATQGWIDPDLARRSPNAHVWDDEG